MIRVFHLITTLETGGAELFLYRLASGLAKQGFIQHVAALVPSEPVDSLLRGEGIPVSFLGLQPGRPNPLAVLRFLRRLREFKPHIVQTWLYHADLLGLFGRLVGVRTLVWNIRCTDMNFSRYHPLTGLTVKLCARLSRLPSMVLTNSYAARDYHLRLGYRPRGFRVIPNGYDLAFFKPDSEARIRQRRALGAAEDDVLVGLAARYDPMKGHDLFAQAAGLALQRCPRLRFVLYGAGVEPCNASLAGQLRASGALARTLLLGRRDDVETLHAAMDIGLSASLFGEGFSNAIAESMACGVPCVSTDTGDASRLVSDTGLVVPSGDALALADALADLGNRSAASRAALGRAARARMEQQYSMDRIVAAYAGLYGELVTGGTPVNA